MGLSKGPLLCYALAILAIVETSCTPRIKELENEVAFLKTQIKKVGAGTSTEEEGAESLERSLEAIEQKVFQNGEAVTSLKQTLLGTMVQVGDALDAGNDATDLATQNEQRLDAIETSIAVNGMLQRMSVKINDFARKIYLGEKAHLSTEEIIVLGNGKKIGIKFSSKNNQITVTDFVVVSRSGTPVKNLSPQMREIPNIVESAINQILKFHLKEIKAGSGKW